MKSAYDTSGKIFEEHSKLHNPGLLEQLRDTDERDIVVVPGTYDHIDVLLKMIKVPFTIVAEEDIPSYNGGRVMLVNCKTYDSVPKKLNDAVRGFVEQGGRLVTTDWAQGLVAKVFPGKIKHTKTTGDEVVEIQAYSDLARRLVGLNYVQCHPQWWLEGSSHIYNISKDVVPIINSDEMKEKYGSPHVAVGFRHGKGEVFHFISHLELQRTRLKSKEDKGSLDDFLKKMKVSKTPDMDDAKVAELEAAYSTLNTLAYLCLRALLLDEEMKSTYKSSSSDASKSKRWA